MIRRAQLDAVLFWLTPTVERDYIARNIFPAVRRLAAFKTQNNGQSLLHLKPTTAAELLADARVQYEKPLTQRGLKVAYRCLLDQLRHQIKMAEERAAIARASAATCTSSSHYMETWYGSRSQLEASGFTIDGPLPGEEGMSKRRGRAQDKRGYGAAVMLVEPNLWPGLFKVEVRLPEEHREQLKKAQQSDKRRRAMELAVKDAPATQAQFRSEAAQRFWLWVNLTICELRDGVGFRLSDASIDEFKDAASEAFHAIREGEVIGESLKKRYAVMQHEDARKDVALQRFIASCRPGAPS